MEYKIFYFFFGLNFFFYILDLANVFLDLRFIMAYYTVVVDIVHRHSFHRPNAGECFTLCHLQPRNTTE